MPDSDHSGASGKKPAQIHDGFFKDVFRVAEYVITLIRAGAPADLFEIIDWSTLSFEPQLIQASRQNEKIADLVFSVALKDSGSAARIVLLFEHKSYRDSELVRQIARNQFLMYLQDQFKSLIVPIVVRQVAAPQREPVRFSNLFSKLPRKHLRALCRYCVSFECLLIDVNEMDRKGLAEKTNIDVVIRAMSKVRDFEVGDLQDLLERIRYVPADDRKRMFDLVFGYVCDYNAHITADEILNLKTKTSEERQMVLSAIDTFRGEGRAEGLQEGRREIAASLLQKGMVPEEVVEVTNLSSEQVETIQKKINGVP